MRRKLKYPDLLELNHKQQEIISGSLLGDGFISPIRSENKNCYFSKRQKESQLEYLKWHFDELHPFSSSIKPHSVNLNGSWFLGNTFITKSILLFTELRKKWYPNNKKIVPLDLVLTPLMIAVWYADDGTTDHSNGRAIFYVVNHMALLI
jgi:hypothetical protein